MKFADLKYRLNGLLCKLRGVPQMPRGYGNGLIPTLNDTGFMFEVLDDYAEAFIAHAGSTDGEVLDMGAAYGVVTLRALEAGGNVLASDLAQEHLDVLIDRTPKAHRSRLRTLQAELPEPDLPENHFEAVICSRVLHFLPGDDVDASIRSFYRWLKPGGRLYLICDTPFGIWRKFIPTWEANIEAGERWPGIMEPPSQYLAYNQSGEPMGPPLMNLMDPDLLSRSATEAGFKIEKATFIPRPDFAGLGHMDGRENCGLIAVKPAD